MANAFKRYLARNITARASIRTVPAGTMQVTVIGLSVANIGSAQASVDVELFDGTNIYYVVKGAPIPVGGALVAIGAEQKIVLQPNDQIRIVSTVAVDAILSVLELT